MPADQTRNSPEPPVLSPFSDAENVQLQKRHRFPLALWVALGVLALAGIAGGGIMIMRHLNDPLRTLEVFPVAKYLEGYQALAGSKFRAEIRVENDLGWKEGVGRLMAFTVRDNVHPIVVMIPSDLAQIYFTKGQNYVGELEVKEGGADLCEFHSKELMEQTVIPRPCVS